jgi:hypothetical protein
MLEKMPKDIVNELARRRLEELEQIKSNIAAKSRA